MNKTFNPTSTLRLVGHTRPTRSPGRCLPRQLMGLLFLVACLPTAMASDSAELRVTGRVLPAPCAITLANNGNADFGTITALELPANGDKRKSSRQRSLPFSIQCVPANSPRLSFKDERTGSVPAVYDTLANDATRAGMFGLGRIADKNIGMYIMYFRGTKADGIDALPLQSAGGGAPWTVHGTENILNKNYKYGWSTTDQVQTGSFGTINGEVVVSVWPEPLDQLPLQSEIKLDGSATLVLEYP